MGVPVKKKKKKKKKKKMNFINPTLGKFVYHSTHTHTDRPTDMQTCKERCDN